MQFDKLNKYLFGWWSTSVQLILIYLLVTGAVFFIFFAWKRKALWYAHIQQKYPGNKQIKKEIINSIIFLMMTAATGLLMFWLSMHNYTLIYTKPDQYGWPYLFIAPVLVILIHDAYFYWTHRAMHWAPIFKYVHKTHHMSVNPTPFSTFSFHPLESLVQVIYLPLIAMVMPFHVTAPIVYLIYMFVMNIGGHLGFEFFPKWFVHNKLTKWLNTSTHHNHHHTNVKTNFGIYFNIWDTLMKTNHKNYIKHFEEVADRRDEMKAQKKVWEASPNAAEKA